MKSINDSFEHGIIKTLLIIMSLVFALSGPYYVLIRYGEHITITSFRIPYIAPGSDPEYFINLVVQAILGGYGVFGCIALEFGSVILRDTMNVSAALTQLETEKLSEDLEINGTSNTQKMRFMHIIRQIKEFDE